MKQQYYENAASPCLLMLKEAKSPEIHSQLEKNSFITIATINSFFDYFEVPLPYIFFTALIEKFRKKAIEWLLWRGTRNQISVVYLMAQCVEQT